MRSRQDTRIDPCLPLVQPELMRAYLAAHARRQQPYPRPEVWVFTKPKTREEGHPTLTAPSSTSLVDYYAGVEDLILFRSLSSTITV